MNLVINNDDNRLNEVRTRYMNFYRRIIFLVANLIPADAYYPSAKKVNIRTEVREDYLALIEDGETVLERLRIVFSLSALILSLLWHYFIEQRLSGALVIRRNKGEKLNERGC